MDSPDNRRRRLERLAAQGDPAAQEQLEQEARRSGEPILDVSQLPELLAALGMARTICPGLVRLEPRPEDEQLWELERALEDPDHWSSSLLAREHPGPANRDPAADDPLQWARGALLWRIVHLSRLLPSACEGGVYANRRGLWLLRLVRREDLSVGPLTHWRVFVLRVDPFGLAALEHELLHGCHEPFVRVASSLHATCALLCGVGYCDQLYEEHLVGLRIDPDGERFFEGRQLVAGDVRCAAPFGQAPFGQAGSFEPSAAAPVPGDGRPLQVAVCPLPLRPLPPT